MPAQDPPDEQWTPPTKATWHGAAPDYRVLADDRHIGDAEAAEAAQLRPGKATVPEPDPDFDLD